LSGDVSESGKDTVCDGPNQRCGKWRLSASTARLNKAPVRLRKNPGARKLPKNKLPATTRNKETQAATFQPKRASTMSVTMFAKPGLTPGREMEWRFPAP